MHFCYKKIIWQPSWDFRRWLNSTTQRRIQVSIFLFNKFHNSGTLFFSSVPLTKSSQQKKIMLFSFSFSSSLRAPPILASNLNFHIIKEIFELLCKTISFHFLLSKSTSFHWMLHSLKIGRINSESQSHPNKSRPEIQTASVKLRTAGN
jgi:hypothetical protein